MYERIGVVPPQVVNRLLEISSDACWKEIKGSGRDYLTSFTEIEKAKDLLPWTEWQNAFFLKIPPDGQIHKHIDTDRNWQTYHVVVQTNDGCISYVEGQPFYLETGGIYSIDRSLEHHSINSGSTDRIHLLAEVYD